MRIEPHRTSPFPALLLEPNEASAVELASRLQAAGFEIRIEGLAGSALQAMIVATPNCDDHACNVIRRHGGDACISLPIDLNDLVARLDAFQLRARPSF